MDNAVRKTIREELLHRLSGGRVMLMGILNVTPDSFSDGGEHYGLAEAHPACRTDAARTAPTSSTSAASPPAPMRRRRWRPRKSGAGSPARSRRCAASGALPLSIDTYKASVARQAAKAGAVIINDVWGMTRDPDMAAAVSETDSLVVVTYNRGKADGTIKSARRHGQLLSRKALPRPMRTAFRANISSSTPASGSERPTNRISAFWPIWVCSSTPGRPVLVGVSRKSFIGRLTGNPVGDRLVGTLTANLDSVFRGASILRVHDVAAHHEALNMLEAIEKAK
jgi:dihydropteroate synthase